MIGEVAGRLLVLARPRLLPAVLLLPALGWAWAHWDRALPAWRPDALLGLLGAWSLLHAGTLWLNAARDRDEGELLLGQAVPVPQEAVPMGILALAAAVGLAWWLDPTAGAWAALCAVLSVLYSHPRTAWKAHPLWGPAVNVVGYGLASPAAGHALVDLPPTPRAVAMAGVVMLGVLGATFSAQAFQEDEDRARGDRTLVALAGAPAAVLAARIAFGTAFAGILALAAWGWLPRVCLVALPAWIWVDRHLRSLLGRPQAGGAAGAVETGRRLAWSTLLVVGAAFGQYVADSARGGPVAGLATVSGHPTVDLRWLSHYQNRIYSRTQDPG